MLNLFPICVCVLQLALRFPWTFMLHVCMCIIRSIVPKAMTSLQVPKFLGSSCFLVVSKMQLQTHCPMLDQTFKVCLIRLQVCLISLQLFNQIVIMTWQMKGNYRCWTFWPKIKEILWNLFGCFKRHGQSQSLGMMVWSLKFNAHIL
jgi:hypothetical protein